MKSIIPTKIFLKKFMASYVALDPEYRPSTSEVFGSFLYNTLDDKYSLPKERHAHYDEKIIVVLPEYWINRMRYDMNEKQITLFNSFAERLFYQQFYQFMDMYLSFHKRQDIGREKFCEIYGIDLDIHIMDETLKKRYDRFCLDRTSFQNPFKITQGKPAQIFIMS